MTVKQQTMLDEFIEIFSRQNQGRPTRLGVFEDGSDYWLEDGLPLVGVDLDPSAGNPTVQIMLSGLTHSVPDVKKVIFHLSPDGAEDGVDLMDAGANTVILRFEQT